MHLHITLAGADPLLPWRITVRRLRHRKHCN